MFDANTKVLVVDDMMTMRKIVSRACKDLGLKDIVTANDGKMAWDILASGDENVGLVISDWNMPNMSGLELLKSVRADKNLKSLPFLMVTAEAEQAQIMEAIASGVDSYVVKPFTPASLKEKLQIVYNKRAAA